MNDNYDKTNRGSLFTNDRKERDTHPDRKGSINVDGKDYWLSAWEETGKSGVQYLSLSVQPKEPVEPRTDTVHEVGDGEIDLNSIPF